MPTPTNSVLIRDTSDEARISQLIYDNESLKIEVETLREQLESSGALKIEDLRKENESLRSEVSQLRVQLEERGAQLGIFQTSNTRFTSIDDSLKQLLSQIESQREELADMRMAGKDKDNKIIELTVKLDQAEKDAANTKEKAAAQVAQLTADAQAAAAAVESEKAKAVEQSQAAQLACAAAEEKLHELQESATRKEKRAAEAEQELLGLKEAAAAQSVARGARATEHDQLIADLRERAVADQEKISSLQRNVDELHANVAELKRTHAAELQQHEAAVARAQQESADANAAVAKASAAAAAANAAAAAATSAPAPPVASSSQLDVYAPQMKAYVEKKVREAVADRDRRLQEQVDQNASLLSRMAMLQHETEVAVKKAGLTGRDVEGINERVDMKSRRKDERNVMQRRVAELLSNDSFSKEDVQVLLQELLDYQEKIEEDVSTQLLIKDLQAEEAEKTFRWNLKRMENENASLLKQLQKAAYASIQRRQRGDGDNADDGDADDDNAAGVADDDAQGGAQAPATVAPPRADSVGATATQHGPSAQSHPPAVSGGNAGRATSHTVSFALNTADNTTTRPSPNRNNPAAQQSTMMGQLGFTPGYGAPPPMPMTMASPSSSTAPVHPPNTHYSQSAAGAPPYAPRPYYQDPAGNAPMQPWGAQTSQLPQPQQPYTQYQPQPYQQQQQQQQYPPAEPSAAQQANRNLLVCCPACTFEQKFGNIKCELCETPLVLPQQ